MTHFGGFKPPGTSSRISPLVVLKVNNEPDILSVFSPLRYKFSFLPGQGLLILHSPPARDSIFTNPISPFFIDVLTRNAPRAANVKAASHSLGQAGNR